jgi:hypothetical protein
VTARLLRRDPFRKRDRGPDNPAAGEDGDAPDGLLAGLGGTGLSPAGADGRPSRARLQGLAALGIYAAFWLVFYARALVLHPELPQLDQSSMDPNFYAWSLAWWPYAVTHLLNPLQVNVIGIPAGFNLAWVTTVPPLALLAWPLTAAFGPIVSLNLLVALAPPLAGWAAFVVCRRLTGRFWPSLAGGTIYGFSAYEINHTVPGHLNLTFSLLLPLMVYLVLLRLDGTLRRTLFIILMTLAMLLQLFLFLETFAQLTLILVTGLPIGYLLAGRPARRQIARLSRQLGVAYAATVVIASPYLYYAIKHQPPGFVRNPTGYSLDLANLIVPRITESFGLGWLEQASKDLPAVDAACYIGLPLLVLAVLFAVRTWRRSRLTRFLAVMFVVILLVAVGPELMVGTRHLTSLPWAHLWNLPLARSAFPNRIMVFGYLALAITVALWLATPLKRPVLRWLLAALAIAALIADFGPIVRTTPGPVDRIPPFIATGEYRHYLTPGESVLVFSRRGNAGLLWQAETRYYFKLAGGFVNAAINVDSDQPVPVQALELLPASADQNLVTYADQGVQTFLKQNHIGAILVEQDDQPSWIGAIQRLSLPPGHAVGGVIIYRLRH